MITATVSLSRFSLAKIVFTDVANSLGLTASRLFVISGADDAVVSLVSDPEIVVLEGVVSRMLLEVWCLAEVVSAIADVCFGKDVVSAVVVS